jgi:CheY-like chemotaxis protein
VLVVDDDPMQAEYAAALIARRDPRVQTQLAHDGFDAGAKLESFRPHAIVLDLMMPGMDGVEVCRRVRERRALDHIRIVAVTGHPTPEIVARVLQAGANVCLAKPYDDEQLLTELGLPRQAP